MLWSFLLVVGLVVLMPGADFVVTVRNAVAHGRRAGLATVIGIGAASAIQGTLVALGLGAVIVQSHLLFTVIKWLGIGYLVWLAATSLRRAWLGRYQPVGSGPGLGWQRALRQGFLSNITNPKMLVFFLSLLPQFVAPQASTLSWLLHAWALPLIGSLWLATIVLLGSLVRSQLLRPVIRRLIDVVSGIALLGFGVRLAIEHD